MLMSSSCIYLLCSNNIYNSVARLAQYLHFPLREEAIVNPCNHEMKSNDGDVKSLILARNNYDSDMYLKSSTGTFILKLCAIF